MNPKVTVMLILVFLVLAGLVYVLNADELSQTESSETNPLQVLPAVYGEYDIVELDVAAPEGTVHFARTTESPTQDWQMTQPRMLSPVELDQVRVNGAAVRLGQLTASQVITGVSNLAQFGLAPAPELTVTLTISNGQQITLHAGSPTPVGGNRYLCRLPAGDTVYLIPAFTLDDLHHLITELPLAP